MPANLPTKFEFQGSKSAQDTILRRVDVLLDEFHGQESADDVRVRLLVVGNLYYATDNWLRLADSGSNLIDGRRREQVYSLFKLVVGQMESLTGVPVNLLPFWLKETFGKTMTAHGVEIDLKNNSAKYLPPEERNRLRLEFRGGLAYRLNDAGRLALVNTSLIQPDVAHRPIQADFAGYVVSESGQFYSGPHMVGAPNRNTGLFHSSYLGGEAVLCAGEIKIADGLVQEINNDSGHYRPSAQNLRMAVEILATYGVKLDGLKVSGHGVPPGSSLQLLNLYRAVNAVPNGNGDNPMSRHQVASTLEANQRARKRAEAFILFQSHIATKRHSWPKRDTCQQCKNLSQFHDEFLRAGGLSAVPTAPAAPVLQAR